MKYELVKELTTADLELIHTFLYAVKNNKTGMFTFTRLSEEQYQEVLRRLENAAPKPVKKIPCKERYKELLGYAEEATGHILKKGDRSLENVFIKCFVATRLVEENYTKSEIGRAMDMTHSSIIFYLKKLNEILSMPIMYEKEVAQYKTFKNLYERAEDN